MPDDSKAIEGKFEGRWDKLEPLLTGAEFRASALEAIDRYLANNTTIPSMAPDGPRPLSWWFRDAAAFLIVEAYCQRHGVTLVKLHQMVDMADDEEEG